ncbi:MAG: TonB-dependent receptor [Rikenellaceae bacterium]|nr:TonB-dependent receptor [Rikenellaceae bacterium]
MKQLSTTLLLAALLLSAPAAMAADVLAENDSYALSVAKRSRSQEALRGRVIDPKGAPVGYATIVAMVGDEQVGGTTSDEQGNFSLLLPAGEYKIIIDFVGFKTEERTVTIPAESSLGDITLAESTTAIDEVVVKAQMIRREADRFVVDVANSDAAIGKDGTELLRQSPGVWVKDDEISINGSAGTKIFINNREIKMTGEQLVRYVKSLRAEDIAKIEVVPQTGADHDADSSGGAIHITLRRRLENGVMGSVSMQTNHGKYMEVYNPSASINAHVGKFDLSASVAWYNTTNDAVSVERTSYENLAAELNSDSKMTYGGDWGGFHVSAVAEINPRHSVGLWAQYTGDNSESYNASRTSFLSDVIKRNNESVYDGYDTGEHYAAALNYVIKTDTLGSTLKFIADYNQSTPNKGEDSHAMINENGISTDSLYNYRNTSLFRIATASIARERTLSSHWKLKYGAKYTYNEINSASQYRYLNAGVWVPSVVDDFDISYAENIGAAYATATMNYGRFSAVVGLRGEYTYSDARESGVSQNYFSLFPNANLSVALDKSGKHSLVAQYSRNIARPSFWNLTPNRQQISDYTFQSGNPLLKPQYTDNITVTAVVAYKYSLTLGMNIRHDAIQQIVLQDPNNPQMMELTYKNLPTDNFYLASLNLPFNVTKWWDWNTNITGLISKQRITEDSEFEVNEVAQWNTNMTFKLPKKFFIDVYYQGMTSAKVSNIRMKGNHSMTFNIKKQIKDSWTLQCGLQNVIRTRQALTFEGDGFNRFLETWGQGQDFNVRLGVTWNFKSGKQFRTKSVEQGADTSRM